jgi:hypothetical protein
MAGLDPAYNQSQALITQQQQGLGAKFGAQKQGLAAEKVQGFNTINNQATGRGMSFSGIPLDEQATYLSTKYLPAVALADQQMNEQDLALSKESAALGREKTNQALGIVEGQKKDLNAWQMQQEQFAQQQRMQEMQQSFQASQAAASRSASAAPSLSPSQAAMAIIGGAAAKGGVSANVFQLARDAYKAAGGNTSTFASEFWKYVPAKANKSGAWKDYYYG